jgi:UDP-glucose-4-epimerase GalE
MTRILVVGGAGYVGSHAAKALNAVGHEVVVFDNLSRGHREFVRWGPLVVGDVRDRAALDQVFRSHTIDAVLHFAALAYVGESVERPGLYYDVNVNGTRNLLDAMVAARVEAIVFSSTCAIYGEPGTDTISESVNPNPINPYGMTKLVCERMMDDFGHAHGLRSVRLRYFNAAGDDPDLEVGEDHEPETHLIPLVLDAAMGRRPSLSILGGDYPTPDGTAIRDYIHVLDLADAHVRALDRLLAGGDTASVNLGTGRGSSVAEVVATAGNVTGNAIPTLSRPRRPGDPARLVADASRARDLLGWSPCRSDLSTILSDAWRWHLHRFGRQRA